LTKERNPHRWLVLALVMTGVFLSTMDSGMINVALPTIMRSFDLSLEHAEFVVTFYLLTITITLVFWGKLADRLGRGNIYLSGMVIFTIGALSCYFSTSYQGLLFSRFIQALGASMMMSSGPAIIKTAFPPDHLGRSLGLVGIATACGLLTGPFVSGLLLSMYSWRSIFLVTMPVSIMTVLLGKFFLPGLKSQLSRGPVQQFDWQGSCCWVGIVILGVSIFHRFDLLLSRSNVLLILAFVTLLYPFIRFERKAINPILPITLFRQSYYWIAVLTAALSFAVLFTVLALIPFYLEYIFLLPVEEVGRLMMAVPATLIVLSPCSGWLYDKIGARFLTTLGLSLSGIALLGLAWLSVDSSSVEIVIKLALLGAGQSIFLSPNSASVLSRVSEKYLGITSGILATARNLGMVIGATFAAALFSWWYSFYSGGGSLGDYGQVDSGSFILALRTTFVLTACLSFLGCVLSAWRK
jgi:EmrB/QacA subfamily drug resistance transporter